MAYYTKGARTLGDVDWGKITEQVTSQVFTPQNVQAATQAAGNVIQQITGQMVPKQPPPPPKQDSGMSPLLIIAGLAVVGGGIYALTQMRRS